MHSSKKIFLDGRNKTVNFGGIIQVIAFYHQSVTTEVQYLHRNVDKGSILPSQGLLGPVGAELVRLLVQLVLVMCCGVMRSALQIVIHLRCDAPHRPEA